MTKKWPVWVTRPMRERERQLLFMSTGLFLCKVKETMYGEFKITVDAQQLCCRKLLSIQWHPHKFPTILFKTRHIVYWTFSWQTNWAFLYTVCIPKRYSHTGYHVFPHKKGKNRITVITAFYRIRKDVPGSYWRPWEARYQHLQLWDQDGAWQKLRRVTLRDSHNLRATQA